MTTSQVTAVAKHLNNRDLKEIVNLIHGWSKETLTWDALCETVQRSIGKKPTRQSLSSYREVAIAYKEAKKRLKEMRPSEKRPANLKIAAARIEKLERELAEAKELNRAYKQQFVIWQYNAYKHGLKEHQLNAPLPKIDRERSDRLLK